MSDVNAPDPRPEDLTEEEQAVDPAANHPDEFLDNPEEQAGG